MHLSKPVYLFLILLLLLSCKSNEIDTLIEAETLSATQELSIGNFVLVRGKLARLTFYEFKSKKNNQVLASTIPGKSFLTANSIQTKVEESRGSFFIDTDIILRCNQQTIDSIQVTSELLIRGSLICADKSQVAYTMRLKPITDSSLQFDIQLFDPKFNQISLHLESTPNEGFFGFGEQFSYFNMKGKRLPILVQEQGIGRGEQPITFGANLTAKAGGDWHTSYAGVPHFISSRMRSLFLENTEYSVFDMTDADRISIEVNSNRMIGQLVAGQFPKELVEHYTEINGRMKALPDWLHRGAIIGMQGGTQQVSEKLKLLQEHNTAIAGFWLQDWVGQRTTSFGRQLWWNWELDKDRYPNWSNLTADLKRQNIRVLGYVNPFLADVAGKKPNLRRNLFKEAKQNDYFVKRADGSPYLTLNTDFEAALIDLTNPAARHWFKSVLQQEMLDLGFSGYMADFGEALPFDAVLSSQVPASSFHNQYPVEWAKLNQELVQEYEKSHPNQDPIVFFMRSGYTKSPAYNRLFWLGDQLVSFSEHDGIKTAVTGLLSSGLSGYSLNHSDIGGYTTIDNPIKDYHRSKELFQRWTEMAAFQTVFRTHEGNRPNRNHQFYSDQETLAHFAKFSRIYAALFDYRKKLFTEAESKGWPVVRSLWFEFPNDVRTQSIDYQQFMLGSDVLVAPVLDAGRKWADVYLPEGNWVHAWSGKEFTGPIEFRFNAPIGEPVVFIRKENDELVHRLRTAFSTNL